MASSLRKHQVSLANLMLATACCAVILTLPRLYPTNPLGLFTFDVRNVGAEAILSGLIATAVCGMVGAFCNRFQRGLGAGGIIGCAVTVFWVIARHVWFAFNQP